MRIPLSPTSITVATAIIAAIVAMARSASAQAPCVPPFCVRIEGPPVRVEAPVDVRVQAEARARAEAEARAQAEASARLAAEIEIRRQAWASWRAYWEWDADLRARAEARVSADLSARLRIEMANTADRYAYVGSPITPPPSYPGLVLPQFELGFIPVCAGMWSGSKAPLSFGFCQNVRVRVTEALSITLDPSLTWLWHDRVGEVTLGASPGVTYSFLSGEGRMARAHAFASAGLDAWVPLEGFRTNPDFFGGGHLGIGAAVRRGHHVGLTTEVRGLVRRGFGTGGVAEADRRSTWRIGFEAKINVVVGF